MNIKNELIDLMNDKTLQLSESLSDALYNVYEPNARRDELLSLLSDAPSILDDNLSLNRSIKNYLITKITDHELLTDDEMALLESYPEIDADRVILVDVTEELIEKAAVEPTALNDEEIHSIGVVITDSIMDDEAASEHQVMAYRNITNTTNEAHETPHNQSDLAAFEFGYNIFDLDAVKKHIAFAYTNKIPLSRREKKIIRNKHHLDVDSVSFEGLADA